MAQVSLGGQAISNMYTTGQPSPRPAPLLQLCCTAAQSQQLQGLLPTGGYYKLAQIPVEGYSLQA